MSRKLILVPFALALLLVATHGSAVNQAACNLYPVDADSAGEDVDLFTNQGGVPNVMFLLDNSGSINRMAPDGAVNTWGSFGNTYGCGNNAFADALRYHSPCSGTTKESMPYDAATDYADIAKVCPYLDTGNKIQTGAPGFDPDVAALFFPKANVYHDNDYSFGGGGAFAGAYSAAACDTIATTTEATRCKGFEENGAAAAATSIATFCANWTKPSNVALTAAELTARRTSCNTCLSTKGYWYSGYYFRNNWMQDDPLGADGTSPMACGDTQWCTEHALGICVDRATKMTEYSGGNRSLGVCRMPHLYFSGNFLNFQPPKFVVLRKVLKDVLMDVKRVRLGLTTFNTGGTGGTLVWKLNPACNQVFPPSQSSFDSNRSSLLGQIKAVNFNTSTPLAETLLNVGQYYRSSGLPWFNSTYQNSAFDPGNGANQASVCFSCQKSSIIIVTDGLSNNDSAIPGTDFAANAPTYDDSIAAGAYAGMAGFNIKGIDATTCPLCNTEDEAPEDGLHPAGEIPLTSCDSVNAKHGACNTTGPAATHLPTDNYLPKVAWYLHHFDTQQDTVKGADCAVMKDHQDLDIYTIGYGLTGNAARILAHTAYRDPGGDPKKDVGGGLAYSASDAHELRQAILDIFNDVNTRSTTFGGASIANVTAAANIDTQIPRFEPSKAAHWEGHLYKFNLWSEFSAGCKPTLPGQPFDTKDVDCDRKCESVFLKDSLDRFIQEDQTTGHFMVNNPATSAPCSPTNHCTPCGTLTGSSGAASPIWDAGEVLKQPASTWRSRNVWTAVDLDLSGQIDPGEDLRVADDDATLTKLIPYMRLGGTTCTTLVKTLNGAGNSAAANLITTGLAAATRDYKPCARVLVQYLLGADVLNESNSDPANFTADRPFKLGDIFHSTPVEVYPPIPTTRMYTSDPPDQLLRTLWDTPGAQWDVYANSTDYGRRNRFSVVGANDGMLHAFQSGTYHDGDDPTTTPTEARYWDKGTGKEIWAFVPPDLWAKTPELLGSSHTFFVDATAFVRDVWVDGSRNRLGTGTKDDVKQESEYHTMLVEGERRGGWHYLALDLTDASDDLDARPKFRWIYPAPGSRESTGFGLTYQDARPAPPTIGPVRIDASTDTYGATASTPTVKTCTGETVAYHERWITFLSGGYDMALAKGHGVHMVDAWTGKEIWDFSQAAATGAADPRSELRFPVAATVGMVASGCGNESLFGENKDSDYFDTASFGDMGGQLWVLRFYAPAKLDASTGLATNWVGARLLQTGRIGCSTASLGQPFFFITAHVINTGDGSLRILAGTGDRSNVVDYDGGLCGPDNIRACLLKGCTVKITSTSSTNASVGTYATPTLTVTNNACFPMAPTTTTTSGACNDSNASYTIDIQSCPNPAVAGDTYTTRIHGFTCTPENDTWSCAGAANNDDGVQVTLNNAITQGNWYFSLLAFKNGREKFDTLAGAQAYDAVRLSESSAGIVKIDGSLAIPPVRATALDDGWARYFTHSGAVTVNAQPYTMNPVDERVTSGTTVYGGIAYWNTYQPLKPVDTSGGGGCSKSPCRSGRAQYSYLYGASVTSGDNGLLDANLQRVSSIGHADPVPPQVPKLHVFVNSAGEVTKGLVSVPVGANPANMTVSGVQDPSSSLSWMDLDERLHLCRHAGNAQACLQ